MSRAGRTASARAAIARRMAVCTGILACALAAALGCGERHGVAHAQAAPVAAASPRSEGPGTALLRELEDKVRRDPGDFVAYTKLAGYYLQRLRETSDPAYLALAERAARRSLDAYPDNGGGLHALGQVELAQHRFDAARSFARTLLRRGPRQSSAHLLAGDASLELGDVEQAQAHFERAEALDGAKIATRTRLARIELLRGDVERARARTREALALAGPSTSAETLAWCHWQLGELAFAVGDYAAAARSQEDALRVLPGYPRALASRGRARAAEGDLAGAIDDLERATRGYPDPALVATLGDLYQVSGDARAAEAQYQLVERIASLSEPTGALHSRALALFHADHDRDASRAYASARREYEARADIYGADVLAWTALKVGRVAEASAAMRQALRLGTRDARLLYHAGMIARAAGDVQGARGYLAQALALSPRFDPLQAPLARRTLDSLR